MMSILQYINLHKSNDARRDMAIRALDQGAGELEKSVTGAPVSIVLKFFFMPVVWIAYICSLAPLMSYLFFCRVMGRQSPKVEWLPLEVLERLLAFWGRFPMVAALKIREAEFFVTERIVHPSLEIGVHTGDHSFALHRNRHITYGLEYLPDLALQLPKGDKEKVFDFFVSADASNQPFRDSSLATVLSVHSVDDMQRPASDIVKEVARTLCPGGRFCFSLFSEGWRRANGILEAVCRFLPDSWGKKLRDLWSFGFYNLMSEREWRELAAQHHLLAESITPFVCGWTFWLFALPFRFEGVLWNLCDLRKIWLLPAWLRRRLAIGVAQAMRNEDTRQSPVNKAKRAMNYYIVLSKPGECSVLRQEADPVPAEARYVILRCVQCGCTPLVPLPGAGAGYRCPGCEAMFTLHNGVMLAHARAGTGSVARPLAGPILEEVKI
jgi:ubiquinone/menaquinone biosynthesis C-methylase UbiE